MIGGFNVGAMISLGDMEDAIDYLHNEEIFKPEIDEVVEAKKKLTQIGESAVEKSGKLIGTSDEATKKYDATSELTHKPQYHDEEVSGLGSEVEVSNGKIYIEPKLDYDDSDDDDEDDYDLFGGSAEQGEGDEEDYEYNVSERDGQQKPPPMQLSPIKNVSPIQSKPQVKQQMPVDGQRKANEGFSGPKEAARQVQRSAIERHSEPKARPIRQQEKPAEPVVRPIEQQQQHRSQQMRPQPIVGRTPETRQVQTVNRERPVQKKPAARTSGTASRKQPTSTKQADGSTKDYSGLEVSALWVEVQKYINANGLKMKPISVKQLEDIFGTHNIVRLINQSYLISLGGGRVTSGR